MVDIKFTYLFSPRRLSLSVLWRSAGSPEHGQDWLQERDVVTGQELSRFELMPNHCVYGPLAPTLRGLFDNEDEVLSSCQVIGPLARCVPHPLTSFVLIWFICLHMLPGALASPCLLPR
jgi:hypothetical protein